MGQAVRPPVESYGAVLFDMNGTFRFEGDRVSSDQDYYGTYQEVGGRGLSYGDVQSAVNACYAAFLRAYEDPKLTECFPSLDEFVATHAAVPVREEKTIAMTIAKHEVGKVPAWAARSVRSVAQRSTVGVVSNVWAPSCHWKAELVASGVAFVLATALFSADVRAIKPSESLFLAALQKIGVCPNAALFVGDSIERGIGPAKMLGMTTCWVGRCAADIADVADFHVQSIVELAN